MREALRGRVDVWACGCVGVSESVSALGCWWVGGLGCACACVNEYVRELADACVRLRVGVGARVKRSSCGARAFRARTTLSISMPSASSSSGSSVPAGSGGGMPARTRQRLTGRMARACALKEHALDGFQRKCHRGNDARACIRSCEQV
eukprot:6195402-Pleurochrysis_carterae.AAC.1